MDTSGPKNTDKIPLTVVGVEMPGTDELLQLAIAKALPLHDVFAQEVASKVNEHGGVAGIRQAHGISGAVKIVVFKTGTVPVEAIDVMLQ